MRLPPNFLALPSSLLIFLLSDLPSAQAISNSRPLPRELERNVQYQPEDSLNRRRDLQNIQRRLEAGIAPVGVKKMSGDESEKFWPEYWGFSDGVQAELGPMVRREYDDEEEAMLLANSSAILAVRPPYLIHQASSASDALARLEKRDFTCPTGTTGCAGHPSSCCNTGDTCVTVQDTGFGTVGCCRAGATCAGVITTCGVNSPCPSDMGGGCCLPGYTCSGIGCILTIVVTIITTISQFSTTQVVTSTITSSSQQIITTTTTTPSPSPSPTPTPTSTTLIPVTSTSTSTTSDLATMPVRPTSIGPINSCPTGFYGCAAYYLGGCCRIDRDCNTYDCPSYASTTIVSNGLTIAVPLTPSATTLATGTCATGWSSCAATLGGNCCLAGYSCGTASCFSAISTAGATTTVVAAKQGANSGSVGRVEVSMWLIAAVGGCLGVINML